MKFPIFLDSKGELGGVSVKLIFFIIVIAAFIPITLIGWRELYGNFLEANPPVIKVLEGPRGVGLTPVSLVLELVDEDAGLDEVVIRARQKRNETVLLRENLEGKKTAQITLPFAAKKSGLDEGIVHLQVRVFDRSFWSLKAEQNFTLQVDYRRPRVEVVTTQHNAREGGSQIIFYKAYDDNLALSGVKVDGQTFTGFPARGLDPAFDDPSVYVAIYAVPLLERTAEKNQKRKIRLFAEDRVGNGTSMKFYNKVAKRRIRDRVARFDENVFRSAMKEILEKNKGKLDAQTRALGFEIEFKTQDGTLSRLIEEFQLLEQQLRPMNESELRGIAMQPRHELISQGAFLSQEGVVRSGYGERITYIVGKEPIQQYLRTEYLLGPANPNKEVLAANDGIVIIAGDFGMYGTTVVVDHGLGLNTLYGSLAEAKVSTGDKVQIGDVLGIYGRSGLADRTQLMFQMRVHGVPVDPTEWLSKTWYQAHVTSKSDDAKRTLGIPVYDGF